MKLNLPASFLLFFLFFGYTKQAIGQSEFNYKRDFKKILARTKDKNDEIHYSKLLKRFTSNDTTLTDLEVLSLMIGFTDKPEYKPYDDLTKEREIYQINGDGDFQKGLDEANEFLKTHPLSVKVLYEKSYSFYKLQLQDSADYYLYQAQRIFAAMFFSGLGASPETPTFALGPADGQDYIRKFVGAGIGTMGSGRDADGNFLDILEAKFEDGNSGNLYFIIQHATDKMFGGKSYKEAMDDQKKKKRKKDK